MNKIIAGAGGKPEPTSPSITDKTITSIQALGSIKTDLEWLIIVLVGLLAYAFIFKK